MVMNSRAGGPSDGEQAAVVSSKRRIDGRSTVKFEFAFMASAQSLEVGVTAEARETPEATVRLL
jgi:hypothetical protein